MLTTNSPISALLYEQNAGGAFLLVTVLLGGGASALAGRAIAATWRPWLQLIGYAVILGLAVRFIHFALFDGDLLSLHYAVVDIVICMAFALLGFRLTRVAQMASQYHWINERAGPLRWRRKRP